MILYFGGENQGYYLYCCQVLHIHFVTFGHERNYANCPCFDVNSSIVIGKNSQGSTFLNYLFQTRGPYT